MNGKTHYTARVRKDVVRELNDDVVAIPNSITRIPGAVAYIRQESAKRDHEDADPGKAINAILDRWFLKKAGVAPGEGRVEVPLWVRRMAMHELIAGRDFDPFLWVELEGELEAEFGANQGEVTSYESRLVRRDAKGKASVMSVKIDL